MRRRRWGGAGGCLCPHPAFPTAGRRGPLCGPPREGWLAAGHWGTKPSDRGADSPAPPNSVRTPPGQLWASRAMSCFPFLRGVGRTGSVFRSDPWTHMGGQWGAKPALPLGHSLPFSNLTVPGEACGQRQHGSLGKGVPELPQVLRTLPRAPGWPQASQARSAQGCVQPPPRRAQAQGSPARRVQRPQLRAAGPVPGVPGVRARPASPHTHSQQPDTSPPASGPRVRAPPAANGARTGLGTLCQRPTKPGRESLLNFGVTPRPSQPTSGAPVPSAPGAPLLPSPPQRKDTA